MAEAAAPSSGGFWRPFFVTMTFTPLFIGVGGIYGQSAGMLPQLLDADSVIPINREEATWIASLPTIGTCMTALLSGTLSDRFGRIRMCQMSNFGMGLGFAVMAAANSFTLLAVGRLLTGLGLGCGFSSSVHISEVAPPAYRGFFLSLNPTLCSVGVIYMYIVGGYLPWNIAAATTSLICMIGFIITFFCYESPQWLLRRNDIKNAVKSIKRLEGLANVDAKLKELQEIANSQPESNFSCNTLTEPTVWKPFILILVSSVLQNTAGFYIVVAYTVQFMREFHTSYDPLQCMVAVGVVRLLAMGIASYLLRHIGRKIVGAMSGFSSAAMLLLIYAYLTFADRVQYLHENSWIPICLFLGYVMAMTLGIFSLPWMMPYEMFPIKVRGLMCGAVFFAMYVVIFTAQKMYNTLMDHLRLDGVILMFAVSSGLFGVFSVTVLVETHKKTLEEIGEVFAGRKLTNESTKT